MKKSVLSTRNIAVIAILGAIAGVLMVFDFPIAVIAPSFYKLDLSDLPCLIGTFALGPIAGSIIEVVKILIKLIIKPTSSAFVGELANLVCGLSLCVTAGIIYKKVHTKHGALISIIVGGLSLAIIGSAFNYFVMIPFYVSMYHIPLETIIAMGQVIIPAIVDKFTFVLFCVLPFNLVKAVVVGFLTFILYKRISPIIKPKK